MRNSRKFRIPGAGYMWTGWKLGDFIPLSHWVVLEEQLARGSGDIIVPDRKNAMLGSVLAVGPEAADEGLRPGDTVIYEEWQGGRWAFSDEAAPDGLRKCLVLSVDSISVVVR